MTNNELNALRFVVGAVGLFGGGWLVYETGLGCTWRHRRWLAILGGGLLFVGMALLLGPIPWLR